MTHLNKFRALSLIEGISLLILLMIAMPAKYYFGHPEAVTVIGWVHGLLFLSYGYMATSLGQRLRWSAAYQMMIITAGCVPFACFMLEKSLRRRLDVVQARI